jgi:leucyl-tRNA synthetase
VYRFVAANAKPNAPDWRDPAPAEISPEARRMQRRLHQAIKRITDEFTGRWHFNTCVSSLMSLVNEFYLLRPDIERGLIPLPLLGQAQRDLVLLLHPFAPYLAHELWEMLGEKGNLLRQPWPEYDAALAKEEEIEIAVQVNGKIRARLLVAADAGEEDVRQLALNDPKVLASLDGKQIVKAIVVPHKLVNIVVQ